jgi:hypothetical protein
MGVSAVGGIRPMLQHGFASPTFLIIFPVFSVPAAFGGGHGKNGIVVAVPFTRRKRPGLIPPAADKGRKRPSINYIHPVNRRSFSSGYSVPQLDFFAAATKEIVVAIPLIAI